MRQHRQFCARARCFPPTFNRTALFLSCPPSQPPGEDSTLNDLNRAGSPESPVRTRGPVAVWERHAPSDGACHAPLHHQVPSAQFGWLYGLRTSSAIGIFERSSQLYPAPSCAELTLCVRFAYQGTGVLLTYPVPLHLAVRPASTRRTEYNRNRRISSQRGVDINRKNRRVSDDSPASLSKRFSDATASTRSTLSTTTPTTANTGRSSKRRQSRTTTRDSSQTDVSSSVFSRSSNSTGLTAVSSSASALFPVETAGAGDRDSFVSIVDDPFFQRFDPANTAHAEREAFDEGTSAEPHSDSDDNNETQHWPPPRRESLTIGPSQYWSHHPISAMESYNIAIIGADAVGKSTFVQRVLRLSRPPVTNTSSARQVVDSVTHMVTLVELDLEHFELSPSQPMQWPKQINGHIVPRMDAALILYDVTTEESIRQLPQTVAALTNSGLPAILGACKCDSPEDDWEVNADELANYHLFKSCVGQYKISIDRPDISQACLQAVIRAAVAHRRDENNETVSRRRAQSAANLEAPDPSAGRPLSEHSKHSRASSDFSILRTLPNQQSGENYRTQASRSPRPGFRTDKSGSDSFLDIDESDSESHGYSDDIPILQRNDDVIIEKQPKLTGVTFEELVDRLLAPRLSRVDNNFSDIFLCLYRKFAAPGELFSAILVRLDKARDDKAAHYLTRTATQLRIIEVVAKWVSLYPGDFARLTTRRNLEDFIKHLSTEPIFAIAAQQMRRNLYFNVIEDDDTGWANSDNSSDEIASKILSKDMDELSAGIGALQFNGEPDSLGGSRNPSTGQR
ncbi:hypothetical protein J3458_000200 [Metarhizium acridum]|uniref:uncharacterized protein n=1 Tax=Metarhizium acridum TaxID=92637 RepID=UPI001C6C18AE|nr:hypothetical protein J3458_000200 [Metarhizium acridum]